MDADRPARCCRSRSRRPPLADEIMSVLMGDDVESRRKFITTNARDVRNLDF